MSNNILIPKKQREVRNNIIDSTQWNDFVYRDDDIIIATWGKAGTTWVQQIIKQLILGPNPDLETSSLSIWLDHLYLSKEEKINILNNQSHRRFIKTHLPADALDFCPKAKYIYVGRNAPDIVWSLYNWLKKFSDNVFDNLDTNKSPNRVGPPLKRPTDDFYEFWKRWLYEDGYPMWSFWENIRSWWNIRDLPFVKFIHFESLKNHIEREIIGISEFLEISVTSEQMEQILEYCSYDWMKNNPSKTTPPGSDDMIGGAGSFYHKGENGQWRGYLNAKDILEYKEIATAKLEEKCVNWLFGEYKF